MEKTDSLKQSWRIFCAVELPEDIRARVAEHAERLRRSGSGASVRWERPEKLHITLKFLGDIEQERMPALQQAATLATSSVQQFKLALEGAGSFPPRGHARVLWLGITDADGSLNELQRRLEDECTRQKFPREERPFRPHITIARLRTPAEGREIATLHRASDFKTLSFNVEEIVVMRSEFGAGGSRYTALSRHGLGVKSRRQKAESRRQSKTSRVS